MVCEACVGVRVVNGLRHPHRPAEATPTQITPVNPTLTPLHPHILHTHTLTPRNTPLSHLTPTHTGTPHSHLTPTHTPTSTHTRTHWLPAAWGVGLPWGKPLWACTQWCWRSCADTLSGAVSYECGTSHRGCPLPTAHQTVNQLLL